MDLFFVDLGIMPSDAPNEAQTAIGRLKSDEMRASE